MLDRTSKTKKGFTLAQLLLLLAIFALIIVLCIPIFFRELERSLESTDFSTARTIYAEFVADILTGDDDAAINGHLIKQKDDSYRVAIYPLAQRIDGWTIRIDNKKIGSVPSSKWIGTPRKYGSCFISYYPETDETFIHWGSGFPLMSLGQLHEVSNKVRIKEDQRLLQELGEQILDQYWTVKKLKKKLELPESAGSDETSETAIKIADYAQLKKDANISGGFKITSTQGIALVDLLRAAGYETGTILSVKNQGKGKKQKTTTYQYSLFFSDELAANHFGGYSGEAAKRSIFIDDIKTEKDVITQMTIYTKTVDDQAPLSEEQEAQFRVTVE